MNLTDILDHFEAVRSNTKTDAIKLEQTLSSVQDKLGDFNDTATQYIEDLSASVTSAINGAEIDTKIKANVLYTRFKDVVIDFPELANIRETDTPEELSALIQEKIALLEPLVEAIVEDEEKSSQAIALINEMIPIGVIPPTDEEDNELEFENELDLRKHQLQLLRPKMSALIAVFSTEEANDTTDDDPEKKGLFDTLLDNADGLAALVNEHPADTYKAGTLFIAGEKFTITTVAEDSLSDHNPTVAYDLGDGDVPVVTMEADKLTLQLGTADHPTTVAQLKTGLEAQASIDTVTIEGVATDQPLVPAAPERRISSYSDWITSKANALNNELNDTETQADLPPEIKNGWDQLQEELQEQGIDELTPTAIVSFSADKLKANVPAVYANLIDKIKEILIDFLESEESVSHTLVDILAEELTTLLPDHASTISFWQSLLKDLLDIDRSGDLVEQLLAIMDGDTFAGRRFEIVGFDLLNLIRNVLQLLKFLADNNISISLEEYPEASQLSEVESDTPFASSSTQTNSTDQSTSSITSNDSTQSTSSNSSTSISSETTQTSSSTRFDFSGLWEGLFTEYMESVLPDLPVDLQYLATHLKDGTLQEYLKALISTDDLVAEWETKKDVFLTTFRDQAGNYLDPSLGTVTDDLATFLMEYLHYLLEQLLGDPGSEDQGLAQELIDALCKLPRLFIELMLHHVPLPDWLVNFLVGEQKDGDEEEANPVLLLLVMPYRLIKTLFEVVKTENENKQAA